MAPEKHSAQFSTPAPGLVAILLLLVLIVSSCGGKAPEAAGTPDEPPALATAAGTLPPTKPALDSSQALAAPTEPETGQDLSATESPPTQEPGQTPDPTSDEGVGAAPTVAVDAAIEDNAGDEESLTTITPVPLEFPEGALISVEMEGEVGILLDEIPESMRDRVADSLINRPLEDWEELARRQVRLTSRRLNFRNFVYSDKGQLPLPPEELWSIELVESGPARLLLGDHDLVAVDYLFTSTLLADAASPVEAEPALEEIGGSWEEPFILPVDPDLLLQRTGNSCVNEAGFPPNSFDSENAWVFFDFACEASSAGPSGCHRSRLANESCIEALNRNVGTIETVVRFERLPWQSSLADEVRVGEVTAVDAPDLSVVGEELNDNRIIYRYFPADSCALLEQCVNDSGWRRLLQFDAVVHNVGGQPLHIGPVVAADPTHNLFQYNACHDHFHFSDYGDFFLSSEEGEFSSKQAFCVESTNRSSNNELSPLTHDYHCRYQGIQSGWIDEYHAGLDCQWIDITDIEPQEDPAVSLGFLSNPDKFLCEGMAVLDSDGFQLWEPSGLVTEDGRSIDRPQCELIPGWDNNNLASQDIDIPPAGTFVTEPCAGPENGGHLGPLRNCGFVQLRAGVSDSTASQEPTPESTGDEAEDVPGGFICDPGQRIELTCSLEQGDTPQTLRVCDFSEKLGTGLGCVFEDALAVLTVESSPTAGSFTCPAPRDEDEPGGRFSLYTAPIFEEDEVQPITCTVGEDSG